MMQTSHFLSPSLRLKTRMSKYYGTKQSLSLKLTLYVLPAYQDYKATGL